MTIFDNIKLPEVLYSTTSEYNKDIEVIQVGPTRKLRVNKVTQSLSYTSPSADDLVWGQVVRLLKEQEPSLGSVLVLGLAGGTMQHFLAQSFPGIRIVSVDIDETIVDVAKRYFDLDQIPNHEVIIEDACRLIVEPEHHGLSFHSFECVIVDIFVGDEYPDLGTAGNFFYHLCKMCVPGGLIVINRMYRLHHQEDVDDFIKDASEYLRDLETKVVSGKTNADNIIIYGRP